MNLRYSGPRGGFKGLPPRPPPKSALMRMIKYKWFSGEDTGLVNNVLEGAILAIPGVKQMSHVMGKPAMWFPNRSNTNLGVQTQKMARGWKFQI